MNHPPAQRGHNLPARLCTGVNRGQVCRQREGCERYAGFLEADGGEPVSVMPAPSYAYECVYFIPVREVD